MFFSLLAPLRDSERSLEARIANARARDYLRLFERSLRGAVCFVRRREPERHMAADLRLEAKVRKRALCESAILCGKKSVFAVAHDLLGCVYALGSSGTNG